MKHRLWNRLRRKLHETEDRDFERAVLRLLSLGIDHLVQTPTRGKLDRAGIDLLARDNQGEIALAIQCKGFIVPTLESDQVSQVKASIDAFASSSYSAHEYMLVYNRDGRDRDFVQQSQQLLDNLVRTGKCRSARLINLHQLLELYKQHIIAHIKQGLLAAAQAKLSELSATFSVLGNAQIQVPFNERLFLLHPERPAEIRETSPVRRRSVLAIPAPRRDVRFTILIGNFGVGKTTAALLSATGARARKRGPTVIYVECRRLSIEKLGSGLHGTLQPLLGAIGIFDHLPEHERSEILGLAAPVLASMLSNRGEKRGTEHEYALVLDGLDENRIYTTTQGISILMNSLSELFCPVILTTRREHFLSTFGCFEPGLHELGSKHGWKRPVRVCELFPWDRQLIIDFIADSMRYLAQENRGSEAKRLSGLLKLVKDQEDFQFYGELITHPLFLRMILDDVVESGVRKVTEPELLFSWARVKISRDIAKRSREITQGWKYPDGFIEQMLMLMEEAAYMMTSTEGGKLILSEYLWDDSLMSLAQKHFDDAERIVDVLLHSLLVPRYLYRNARFSVEFIFQIFHEFFFSCYVVRHGIEVTVEERAMQDLIEQVRVMFRERDRIGRERLL